MQIVNYLNIKLIPLIIALNRDSNILIVICILDHYLTGAKLHYPYMNVIYSTRCYLLTEGFVPKLKK